LKIENDGSKRYIVAYPSPDTSGPNKISTNKVIYWFKREAEQDAKVIGGWVIEVDLRKK
jgi:hypothetical protein